MEESNTMRRIIVIVLILVALFSLTMPWIKLRGSRSEMGSTLSALLSAAESYNYDEDFTYNDARTIYDVFEDYAISPAETVMLVIPFSKINNLLKEYTSYDADGVAVLLWFLAILVIVTFLAGIHSLVVVVQGKTENSGRSGFLFFMFLLALMFGGILITLNTSVEDVNDYIESYFGYYNAISFKLTFWMFVGLICSIPFKTWEKKLEGSSAGKKALASIDQASAKVDKAKVYMSKKIKDYQAGWECPECGAHNTVDARFCSRCGSKKPEDIDIQNVKRPEKCPSCGQPIGAYDKFCKYCGFNMEEYMNKLKEEAKAKAEEEAKARAAEEAKVKAEEEKNETAAKDKNELKSAEEIGDSVWDEETTVLSKENLDKMGAPLHPLPEEKAKASEHDRHEIIKDLRLTSEEAASGCTKIIKIKGVGSIKVNIPAGISEGRKIRLKEVIPESLNNGVKCDLVLKTVIEK